MDIESLRRTMKNMNDKLFFVGSGALSSSEIIEQYESNLSINILAHHYCTTEYRIRKILIAGGVRIRTQAEASAL